MKSLLILGFTMTFSLAPVSLAESPGKENKPGGDGGPSHYSKGRKTRDGIGKYYMGREISYVMGHQAIRWFINNSFNIRTEYRQHFFKKFQGGVSIPVELTLGVGLTI